MRFRTEIETPPARFRLDPTRETLFVGSCFTDNIGMRLRQAMSPATVNPCGVQYNPESMAQLLECALAGEGLPADSIFFHDGLWRCWLMPSAFAAVDRSLAEAKAAKALRRLADSLRRAQALVATFGTAQVYIHLPSATSSFAAAVSNCHKVPQNQFRHTMLTSQAIAERWQSLVGKIRRVNPDIKLIYTVSPVRHLNPSPRLNTLSKATLHLAVESLVGNDDGNSEYFCAWELLMDDLRDYRFYAADMTHPSEVAADYIHEAFCRTFFSAADRSLLEKGASIARRLAHRRLTDDTEADLSFREKSESLAQEFIKAHPGMILP